MRFPFLALFAALFQPALAVGAPLVVWVEPEIPEGRAVVRAERSVGGAAVHLSYVDLALSPSGFSEADARAWEALRATMANSKDRWNEFDVEQTLAVQLEVALSQITMVRDAGEREQLAAARLLQGSAVANAFSPKGFTEALEADPFRQDLSGFLVNKPWWYARSLEPLRRYDASAVMGGALYERLGSALQKIDALPVGTIDLSKVPGGTIVYIDGAPIAGALGLHEVSAGRHYVHGVRGDHTVGRAVVEIDPGQTVPMPLAVSPEAREEAHHGIMRADLAGLPRDLKSSLDAWMAVYDGPVFLAAEEEGKVVVLPYARGAQLTRSEAVTLVTVGEMGGGAVVSAIFDGSEGTAKVAPGAHGGLGFELGVYQGILAGALDVAFVPGQTVTHANRDQTDNVTSSILAQPWGGVGAYILRPTERRATLAVLATLGWNYPAFVAKGARVSLGIPMEGEDTWFRITAGASTAPHPVKEWREATSGDFAEISMHTAFFRVGVETRAF